MHFLILVLLTSLTKSNNGRIARPKNFYGSEALLDGYCDDAQYFIDAFTMSGDRLTVKGNVSDVTQELYASNHTGRNSPWSSWMAKF